MFCCNFPSMHASRLRGAIPEEKATRPFNLVKSPFTLITGATNEIACYGAKSSGCMYSSILCTAARGPTSVAARICSGTRQLRQARASHCRAPEETRTQLHPYRCEGRHHQSVGL